MIYCVQTCDKNSETSSENYPISIPIAPNKHNIFYIKVHSKILHLLIKKFTQLGDTLYVCSTISFAHLTLHVITSETGERETINVFNI